MEHKDYLGKKAISLYRLLSAGLNVPSGIVLDNRIFMAELEAGCLATAIDRELDRLNEQTIPAVAGAIERLWSDYHLSSDVVAELSPALDPGKSYAVRSSASLEDLDEASFAGQYDSVLRLSGVTAISEGIKLCYRSLYSERSLSYLYAKQGKVSATDLKMAIIVQEMVDAKAGGVLFTAHPLLGLDREMLVELTSGTGEALVGGQVKPVSCALPWFGAPPAEALEQVATLGLDDRALLDLRAQALEAAKTFGFPLDIEFAIDQTGSVHLLQARAITSMRYDGIEGLWTTADFKDGGVSAQVCRRYMWSLYEFAWEHSLKQFLVDGKLLSPAPNEDYSRMFFGRPYWNLNIAKQAMRKVPGYKERNFDADYGITGQYDGDGETTPINLKTILRFLPTALAQRKLLKEREANARHIQTELLTTVERYHERLDKLSVNSDLKELADLWLTIHYEGYPLIEGSYFHQIFLNTIHQTLIRDTLLKQMDESDYLALLGGLEEVSHLLPFYDLWRISRKIRQDATLLESCQAASVEELAALLMKNSEQAEIVADFKAWFTTYGYHSAKELDISEPNYSEAPELILSQLQTMLSWGDKLGPEADRETARAAYDKVYERLVRQLGPRKARRLGRKVNRMRGLLWWREEFRDLSTRYYDLIRRAALLLAKEFCRMGLLADEDEIWQLKIEEIRSVLRGEMSHQELHETIRRADLYYHAYRHFMSANELPNDTTAGLANDSKPGDSDLVDKAIIKGISAGGGLARGPARVIRSLAEIDHIQTGDILVTRFTDTGWTVKFAVLAGIVTEYGGVLSHAAIVSREYGIPCVVGATGAMEQVADGAEIVLDAGSGRVWLAEDREEGKHMGGGD
ncbi:MAG: PEP/pyruvate-binding domain-containing protein [Fastidiosipilaceae bacterium]|jgi:phosphohistidine swiveling domain-containing protein